MPYAHTHFYFKVYLRDLVEAVKMCMRGVLTEASRGYEEKPKQQWLHDFCAQMVILVSRIVWTEEVAMAFDALEDGNETALKDYQRKQVN